MTLSLRAVLAGSLLLALVGCSSASGPDRSDPAGPPSPDPGEGDTSPPATTYTSQPARVTVGGGLSEWEPLSVRHADPSGDGGTLDLGRLWVAHDAERLFLRVELSEALNLQEGNDLTLHLDTDNDTGTGRSVRGIGADVSWTFGDRSGQVITAGGTEEVEHADLGFASLPTVRASTFEMAFDRSATPGGAPLFPGDSLRLALTGGGDALPDAEGGLGYVLRSGDVDPLPAPTLTKPDGALRLLSYNVARDALFDAGTQGAYSRLLRALHADIIGFQEVYEHSAEETRARVVDLVGRGGPSWRAAKAGLDNVLLTRFPIEATHAIPGYDDNRSGAFLVAAREAFGTRLLVIVTHPPCCNYADAQPSRDAQRQQVVDGIAAFIRDVKAGAGPFAVPQDTPIAILGDMNFVGDPQQAETLRTGEIVNTDRFGPPAAPDWDDSPLLDTNPRQAGAPLHATWVNPGSSFPPGRLDYAYVSDSVLEVANEYVLYTPALSGSALQDTGLDATDTNVASDHLPVVVDVTRR